MTLDETVDAAERMAAGVREMRKRIKELESRVKRHQTNAQEWREVALRYQKEITRLKRTGGYPSGR